MPRVKHVDIRHQVLNRCFRNPYREYTIDDLVDECNKEMRRLDKSEISKRTVLNDIATMEADYGILLDENLYRGRKRLYRYLDIDYSLPSIQMDDNERYKLKAAINVLEYYEGEPLYDWARTLLMQIEGGLFGSDSSQVVSFQSNADYTGLQHFYKLLKAILAKQVLKLQYTPFDKETITEKIYPYYLKQYNDRWFLIAQVVGYDSYSRYALDRIDNFKEIALPYKEAEIDFEDYFDDVIGVTVPDTDAVDVVLKVNPRRYNYIRTKPLHLTQHTIEEMPDYVTISINVKINNELEALILSFGSDIEVISPQSFRNRIAEKYRQISKKYANDEENLHS